MAKKITGITIMIKETGNIVIIKKMSLHNGGILIYICALFKLKLYDVQSGFYRYGWHAVKK